MPVTPDQEIYIQTIMAAETVGDFQAQFVDLLRKHPTRDDFAIISWLADKIHSRNRSRCCRRSIAFSHIRTPGLFFVLLRTTLSP